MKYREFTLAATGADLDLHVHLWEPEQEPLAVLQISHGMAEHGGRYAAYAERLTAAGFVVVAPDHRGHGHSVSADTPQGSFGPGGWAAVVEDFHLLSVSLKSSYPSLPLLAFGHSMGSHVLRDYLRQYSGLVDGAVFSASFAKAGIERLPGLAVAKLERWRKGEQQPSALINALTFDQFNRVFKPNLTAFDWLSRDAVEVDKYVLDPMCGFTCSTGLWVEFLTALGDLENSRTGPRPDLPVLIMGGDADPSIKGRKGLESLQQQCRDFGLQSVDLKVYADARHEILNEINRDAVLADLIAWLSATLGVK